MPGFSAHHRGRYPGGDDEGFRVAATRSGGRNPQILCLACNVESILRHDGDATPQMVNKLLPYARPDAGVTVAPAFLRLEPSYPGVSLDSNFGLLAPRAAELLRAGPNACQGRGPALYYVVVGPNQPHFWETAAVAKRASGTRLSPRHEKPRRVRVGLRENARSQ